MGQDGYLAMGSVKANKAAQDPWTHEGKIRLCPQVWVPLSLPLYAKHVARYPAHARFALHIPLEKYVATSKTAKEALKEHPGMPVMTVEWGANRLAVTGACLDSQLMATQFIPGGELNHNRHLLWNTLSNKRPQGGRVP